MIISQSSFCLYNMSSNRFNRDNDSTKKLLKIYHKSIAKRKKREYNRKSAYLESVHETPNDGR